MSRELWAVMGLWRWDALAVTGEVGLLASWVQPMEVKLPSEVSGSKWFIPVFDDKEAAEVWAEGKYEVVKLKEGRVGESMGA